MIISQNICWDACVFIRHITQNPIENTADISLFIEEARTGHRVIYFSTINIAEVSPARLKGSSYGTFLDFARSMGRSFVGIDPNPNIMHMAALLKDSLPTNPSPKEETNRLIGTGDAIHLATCLYLRDVMGVHDVVFHTFDRGKGKTWEGRCVPLIGMERWYPAATRPDIISAVCSLSRTEPTHPQADLISRREQQ